MSIFLLVNTRYIASCPANNYFAYKLLWLLRLSLAIPLDPLNLFWELVAR